MSSDHRAKLLTDLLDAMRDNGGRGLMLHQGIAQRFGLNSTDLKCLDLARAETELTAGRIAVAAGLSTSAVTAVLDRLERAGFLARRRDATDRRKVVVISTGRHEAEVSEIFSALKESVSAILADYDDDQLSVLLEIIGRLNDLAWDFTIELSANVRPHH